MTDSFALFGVPRRPALDQDVLKQAYFRLAAALHPDASKGDADQFTVLQESLKILSEPAKRLRHLAELEFPGHEVPASKMGSGDLFLKIGAALQIAKVALEKRDAAKSTLAKAVLAREGALALQKVREVIGLIEAEESSLAQQLADLDQRWPEVSAGELEELASALTYIARWRVQIVEWEFRLAQG